MTQDQKNILEIKEFYILKSKKTEKIFIDENNTCYLIQSISDAGELVTSLNSKYPDAKIYKEHLKQRLKQDQYYYEYYSLGIDKIYLKESQKDSELIEINPKDFTRNMFFNHDTNSNILLLKETSKKKYLRALKKNRLLCPIKIDVRMKKKYPHIHYANATMGNNTYLLIFTTIKEFEKWNESQDTPWSIIDVDFLKLKDIRKNMDLFINPLSDKLILPNKYINEVLSEKD